MIERYGLRDAIIEALIERKRETQTQAYMHTCTRTHAHAHTYTRAHTHTHTHTHGLRDANTAAPIEQKRLSEGKRERETHTQVWSCNTNTAAHAE